MVFEARKADARHAKLTDRFVYTAGDGRRRSFRPYAAGSVGDHVAASMLEVHRGAFFGMPGRVLVLLSSLCLPVFAVTGLCF